jgi:oligopeptidase B
MQPPKLEKRPKKHKFWNHEIEDSHYYLEENWQEIIKNPKLLPQSIQDYIAAENQYANNYFKDTKEIQDILFKEMRGRIKEDERSVEMKYGDYYYYSYFRKKNKDQGHYSLSCRKFKNMKTKEEIIFDGDLEAKETKSKYFSSATGLSLCQKYLAIGTDKIGNEEYNLIIREIKTKK